MGRCLSSFAATIISRNATDFDPNVCFQRIKDSRIQESIAEFAKPGQVSIRCRTKLISPTGTDCEYKVAWVISGISILGNSKKKSIEYLNFRLIFSDSLSRGVIR